MPSSSPVTVLYCSQRDGRVGLYDPVIGNNTRYVIVIVYNSMVNTYYQSPKPELVVDKHGVLKMEDNLISDSVFCRMLGVTLQNNLSWGGHLMLGKKPLLPAVRRMIGMITRASQGMSKKTRLKLVNSLVVSRLTYRLCLWGNTTRNHQIRVQTVLNSAARLITGLPRTTRQSTLMEDCNWLSDWNDDIVFCF